jgi:hypothetical protein
MLYALWIILLSELVPDGVKASSEFRIFPIYV